MLIGAFSCVVVLTQQLVENPQFVAYELSMKSRH